MTDAFERARADLAAGRAWKARDRLAGIMATRTDDEVLDLLGEVYFAMHDLPAAGALWFVTGRSGADADEAIAAWRERFGGAEARWHSIPRGRRLSEDQAHLIELERSAKLAARARWATDRERVRAGNRNPEPDWAFMAFMAVVVMVLVLLAIGAVTVLRWIFA